MATETLLQLEDLALPGAAHVALMAVDAAHPQLHCLGRLKPLYEDALKGVGLAAEAAAAAAKAHALATARTRRQQQGLPGTCCTDAH